LPLFSCASSSSSSSLIINAYYSHHYHDIRKTETRWRKPFDDEQLLLLLLLLQSKEREREREREMCNTITTITFHSKQLENSSFFPINIRAEYSLFLSFSLYTRNAEEEKETEI